MKTFIDCLFIVTGLLLLGVCEADFTNPIEPGSQAFKIGSAENSGQLCVMTQNVHIGTYVDRILMVNPVVYQS